MWFGNHNSTNEQVARVAKFDDKIKNILQKINIEGFLKKRGEKGLITTWKKRWFSLKDCKLVYSKEPNGPPIGHIQLLGRVVVSIPEHNFGYEKGGNHWGFEIVTKTRVWALQTTTEKELQRWLNTLKVFLKYTVNVQNSLSSESDLEHDWETIPSERDLIRSEVLFSNVHLLLNLINFIDHPKTLCSLACVNHLCYQLSKTDNWWILLFERKFGSFTPIRKGASVKTTYMALEGFNGCRNKKKK